MKIVKPTRPESMSVIVDTIVTGEVMLSVTPAEVTRDRVDIVYVVGGVIGIACGPSIPYSSPAWGWPLPVLPEGSRSLAKIYVHRCQAAIYESSITELS